MKLTLHKLKEGFIILSDEGSKKGELTIFPSTENGRIVKLNTPKIAESDYATNGIYNLKVIAQQDQIDFSEDISEEKLKEIGWFDVEKLIGEDTQQLSFEGKSITEINAYKNGALNYFQKAQELLSDRMFTINDMKRAFSSGVDAATLNTDRDSITDYEAIEQESKEYFDELKETKSWEIEIEMLLQKRWGTEWHDLPNQTEGREPDGTYRVIPKFINNKIKITKIL